MEVDLRLSTTLRKYVEGYDPVKGSAIHLDSGLTVSQLCELLGIPEREIKIIMVDGKKRSPGHTLKGGERVALFPPVGGG